MAHASLTASVKVLFKIGRAVQVLDWALLRNVPLEVDSAEKKDGDEALSVGVPSQRLLQLSRLCRSLVPQVRWPLLCCGRALCCLSLHLLGAVCVCAMPCSWSSWWMTCVEIRGSWRYKCARLVFLFHGVSL